MPQKRFWNRTGYLELEGYGKPIEGLDFKFDIVKTGDFYSTFSTGVLGLSVDHIGSLTTWNPVKATQAQRKIKIFAGYETIGTKMLCDGYILNATPTPPPNMWLNIEGMIRIAKDEIIQSPITVEETQKEVFDEVCGYLGMKGRWRVKNNDGSKKVTFTIEGKKTDLPNKMAKAFNVLVFQDDGVLVATDKNGETIKPDDSQIQVLDIDHGLISIAQINIAGADLRVRLNDTFKMMSWVELHSKLMPKADGLYYVIQQHHVGHMRGNEWYTELKTVRKDFDK